MTLDPLYSIFKPKVPIKIKTFINLTYHQTKLILEIAANILIFSENVKYLRIHFFSYIKIIKLIVLKIGVELILPFFKIFFSFFNH